MAMLDVTKILGPNWKVDDYEKVTASNQMSMSSDLPDACELKNKAVQVKSAWGGQPSYAPPLGWTVYWVSKPAGSAGGTLNIEDTLWVNPQGVAYSVTSCAKGVTSGEAVKVILSEQKKKTDHTWLLIGALGVLTLLTFSK
jgi:hypothetical protein